jgi:hypothetical protein
MVEIVVEMRKQCMATTNTLVDVDDNNNSVSLGPC